MSARTGHCLCGAVSFTAESLGGFGVCHCTQCQRWAGGPFFGVTVKAEEFSVAGTAHVGTYISSGWASRSFCKECGSPLWYRYDPEKNGGGTYEIPVGLLDDTSGLHLEREIYIDRKPAAFDIAGDHPRLTEAEVEKMYAGSQQGA